MMRAARSIAAASVLALLGAVPVHAQGASADVSFDKFIKGVQDANLEQLRGRQDSKVRDAKSLDAMRSHILGTYQGSVVKNSFLDASDNVVDCITTESQAGLRDGAKAAEPPPKSAPAQKSKSDAKQPEDARTADRIAPQLAKDQKDRLGNETYCAPGTIPKLRLTLDRMMRFDNLDSFFGKKNVPPPAKPSRDGSLLDTDGHTHYWAHARQYVDNHGGSSNLNLWHPERRPGYFSLLQHWYVGGTGTGLQTVEGGVIVSDRYSNNEIHLFIYRTAANYAPNSGCWDLDCPGFVQTDNRWVIGGALKPVSTRGGQQYDVQMQWQLYQGNWWLTVQGVNVGYYPGSVFRGGQMSRYAQSVDFGGEVSGQGGSNVTGQMGSGALATEGWQKAAYQRNIFFIDTAQVSRPVKLSPTGNNCYTINLFPESGNAEWGTYFFFGGPKCP